VIVPDYVLRALYVPRSQPDTIIVNVRCLGGVDGPSLRRTHFFDGRHLEEAERRRIAEGRSYIRFRIGWGAFILDRAPDPNALRSVAGSVDALDAEPDSASTTALAPAMPPCSRPIPRGLVVDGTLLISI
jgi:hypothetical protein